MIVYIVGKVSMASTMAKLKWFEGSSSRETG
jgi:hypothetical protein